MIDHLTIHVPPGTLERDDLAQFFDQLNMDEVPPNDVFEHGWKVRWFRDCLHRGPAVHLVEGFLEESEGLSQDRLGLGHFCVRVGQARVRRLASSHWCVRASGSGRIWLQCANIRVEVRP